MRAISSLAPAPPRASLAEQVYGALKQQMHDFALVPGDRFSEAELAQRLSVSRTPVREALFRLRNEGLLDVDARSGWYVRPIDFARIEQLYDLRVLIESTCVSRLCAMPTPPPKLEALKATWLVPNGATTSVKWRRWTKPFTPAWWPPPAMPKWRGCTGT
jgi:DNA-binding GntR family transcriptional regulator